MAHRRGRRRLNHGRGAARWRRRRAEVTAHHAAIEALNRWFLAGSWQRGVAWRGGRGRDALRAAMAEGVATRMRQARCAQPSGEVVNVPATVYPDVYSSLPFSPAAPIVPLTAANVALPDPAARRVHLFDVLPPDVVALLRRDGIRRIGPAPKPDFKPAWGVEKGEYEGIVRKAVAAGVMELRQTPADSIQGLFGLEKSDQSARMLVDCRPANLLCWTPPDPKLPLIEVLRLLGVEPGHRLFAALLDLSNYFYALMVPEEWRSLFGLPPLWLDGDYVHPVMAVCPMEASFSVFVAQLAHVTILESRSPMFQRSFRLDGPLVPLLIRDGEVASAPMIDDLVSLSTLPTVTNAALDEFASVEAVDVKLEKVVHARAGTGTRVWGQFFDPDGCVRPVPSKLVELIGATRACLARPVIRTHQATAPTLWKVAVVGSAPSPPFSKFRSAVQASALDETICSPRAFHCPAPSGPDCTVTSDGCRSCA